MVREPDFGRQFGDFTITLQKPPGELLTECRQSRLTERISVPFIAAKARSENWLVAGKAKGPEEQSRDLAIARWDRVIGWFQRRIESDAHALGIAPCQRTLVVATLAGRDIISSALLPCQSR